MGPGLGLGDDDVGGGGAIEVVRPGVAPPVGEGEEGPIAVQMDQGDLGESQFEETKIADFDKAD